VNVCNVFDAVQQRKTDSHQKKREHETELTVICIMKCALQLKHIDRLLDVMWSVMHAQKQMSTVV